MCVSLQTQSAKELNQTLKHAQNMHDTGCLHRKISGVKEGGKVFAERGVFSGTYGICTTSV